MGILVADKELRCVRQNVIYLEECLGIRITPKHKHSFQKLFGIKTYREKLKEKKL